MRAFATRRLLCSQRYLFLEKLGLFASSPNPGCWNGKEWIGSGDVITSTNPYDNSVIGQVYSSTPREVEQALAAAKEAQYEWAAVPAPVRGAVIRDIGHMLRQNLEPLSRLLTAEMGKILPEAVGEIQEYIDVCDFATGICRALSGGVIPSERKEHALLEFYHPIGVLGLISAFNFPVAVGGWNTAINLICGNTQILKGAPTTPLVNIAVQRMVVETLRKRNLSPAIATFVTGGRDVGEQIINDPRIPLVSFTGSCPAGAAVSSKVSERFGRCILELGGNNAMVVMGDADLELALRSIVFGAVGTAGQRCTTTRRLYLHSSIYDTFIARLLKSYEKIPIGDPLKQGTLLGPLHTQDAVRLFQKGVNAAAAQGAKVLYGGSVIDRPGNFVEPTIIETTHDCPLIKEELFVPILYVMKFDTLEEAIQYNNGVEQGLTSSLFTQNMQNVFKWTGPNGSDCGIVNVNCGTSGAEIGGAFGGNKATGWGRECGSDSWKQYCRRGTATINYGNDLPLAQGIDFTA